MCVHVFWGNHFLKTIRLLKVLLNVRVSQPVEQGLIRGVRIKKEREKETTDRRWTQEAFSKYYRSLD